MIVFKCMSCGSRLRVGDDKAGKRGKCPKCGTMLRVPRTQQDVEAGEAHRAVLRVRKLDEQRRRETGDDDIFNDVMGELLSGRPVRKSPGRHDPQRDALGVDRQVSAEVAAPEAPAEQVPSPPAETPEQVPAPADQADGARGDDAEALRRSAEAPSAPPMSWPAEPAAPQAADDAPPPSDLDALAQAARAVRTPDPTEDDETTSQPPELPDGDFPQVAEPLPPGTAPVKGSHGLLALLVVLAVVAAVAGTMVWRHRRHTWQFRNVIARCLPSVRFPTDGTALAAVPGSLAGKVLLCNASGGPCSLRIGPDPRIAARSAVEVGTVVFVRRNDNVPKAWRFRVMGRRPAHPPVGYELCAVDVPSRRLVCADTVVGADDTQAVEALHRLVGRCVRRRGN